MFASVVPLALVLALTSSLIASSPPFAMLGMNSACMRCNISELPESTFRHRYISGCMVCGEFYGTQLEHCCMCHHEFFLKCRIAAGYAVLERDVAVGRR